MKNEVERMLLDFNLFDKEQSIEFLRRYIYTKDKEKVMNNLTEEERKFVSNLESLTYHGRLLRGEIREYE